MTEYNAAIALANAILDEPGRDPDDDLSVLARQLLRAIEHDADWQPIETAPKDGTRILIHSGERCSNCPDGTLGISVAYWHDDAWSTGRNAYSGADLYARHQPTHWMPAPIPPTEEIPQ